MGGSHEPDAEKTLEAGKDKEKDSLLELPEKNKAPARYHRFGLVRSVLDL